MARSKKRLATVLGLFVFAILAFGVVAWFIATRGRGFTPTIETVTFERDVRIDHGVKLDPNNIISTNKRPFDEIFSKENMGRYGADTVIPDGVGLTATFRVKRGSLILKERTFTLPGWQYLEETTNSDRRALVESRRPEFEDLVAEFAAPVDVNFISAVVVDTTDGVSDMVKERVANTMADTVGDLASGKSTVYAYTLHELAYQGNRQKIVPNSSADITNALDSFLAAKGAAGQSSVLRGLQSVVTDINSIRKGEPIRIDVWTDGLENTESISVYSTPSLLDPGPDGWEKLDGAWNPTSLDLAGLELYLHPLPPSSSQHERMTFQGLEYLRDRLSDAGATVTVEVR